MGAAAPPQKPRTCCRHFPPHPKQDLLLKKAPFGVAGVLGKWDAPVQDRCCFPLKQSFKLTKFPVFSLHTHSTRLAGFQPRVGGEREERMVHREVCKQRDALGRLLWVSGWVTCVLQLSAMAVIAFLQMHSTARCKCRVWSSCSLGTRRWRFGCGRPAPLDFSVPLWFLVRLLQVAGGDDAAGGSREQPAVLQTGLWLPCRLHLAGPTLPKKFRLNLLGCKQSHLVVERSPDWSEGLKNKETKPLIEAVPGTERNF